jgi:formylglycine-generating enzyme required for sulfatase activity
LLSPEALTRPWRELYDRALSLEAAGDRHLAATAYDLAWGASLGDPDATKVAEHRARLLAALSVTEHELVFRYVPAGPFVMGNDEGEHDEYPAHPVTLSHFWITDTPITWSDYCRLMGWLSPEEGGMPRTWAEGHVGETRSHRFALHEENKIRAQYCESETQQARDWHAHVVGNEQLRAIFAAPPRHDVESAWRYGDKPMVCVGWHDAVALASTLSREDARYALPSEAQWEKAARGALRGCLYPWGDSAPTTERCDFGRFQSFSLLVPRALIPNAYGLHAMVGSVWEWTSDWYDAEHYFETHDAILHDPTGPATGEQKVIRGGSWSDCEDVCTVSFRASMRPASWRSATWNDHTCPNIGFRLVRTEAP